ncbi:MAG TPA: acyl-CoA dehydratase activase [Bacillota bacterium]|nr:acyl-CoA dehydratase activase [Bacillota bacterium]HOR86768.1 acyl-CoA dehydratase activase [Bacillota bacterium]HPL54432.1 acyl-CoA dehydratase activase [Bacillota bacterium]
MYYTGIDIGSTSAKAVVLNDNNDVVYRSIMPTGWSSVDTAEKIKKELAEAGIDAACSKFVATGYGRISVPYADKTITEITCHGKGAAFIYGDGACTVIDIGGQDTKIINISKCQVINFIMNDKCSAGTGRFLEVMANTLGVGLSELFNLASAGSGISISSMCTVFAESEVVSLIGSGHSKEDIAYGIVESITNKVKSLCGKLSDPDTRFYLTGGLCESDYIIESLSDKLGSRVVSNQNGRYAGAIGAALSAKSIKQR